MWVSMKDGKWEGDLREQESLVRPLRTQTPILRTMTTTKVLQHNLSQSQVAHYWSVPAAPLVEPFMKELLRFEPPVPFYPYYYWVGCTILQSCSWVQLKKLATLALAWIMSVAWLDPVLYSPLASCSGCPMHIDVYSLIDIRWLSEKRCKKQTNG